MANPAYMYLKDEQGNQLNGDVNIQGRENSIEVLAFDHKVFIPNDQDTGALTSTRKHDALKVVKAFDPISPVLYKACCDGKTLKQLILKWYRVDENGREQEYFSHQLDNVKVVSVKPCLRHIKERQNDLHIHEEQVEFRYEKITWLYKDGNIQAYDVWTERC